MGTYVFIVFLALLTIISVTNSSMGAITFKMYFLQSSARFCYIKIHAGMEEKSQVKILSFHIHRRPCV